VIIIIHVISSPWFSVAKPSMQRLIWNLLFKIICYVLQSFWHLISIISAIQFNASMLLLCFTGITPVGGMHATAKSVSGNYAQFCGILLHVLHSVELHGAAWNFVGCRKSRTCCILFPLPTVAAINNNTQTTSCHAGQHSMQEHKALGLA